MASVLDLLINEVANVLAISPEEVKQKFTEEQLKELLNSVWCEPNDELGIPIDSLQTPCDDLAVPNLLPELDVDAELDAILAQTVEKEKETPVKCIEKIDEVNSIIEKQIEEYTAHKNLLDKLIEYRDNFFPISIYYKERAEEGAKVLNAFQPFLREDLLVVEKIEKLREDRAGLTLSIAGNPADSSQILKQIDLLQEQIDALQERRNEIKDILSAAEETIFTSTSGDFLLNADYFNRVLNYNTEYEESFDYYVVRLFDQFISYEEISDYSNAISRYSECLLSVTEIESANSVQEIIERSYFSFTLNFIQLNGINLEREKYDRLTETRKIEKSIFPIKGNQLLQKDSFFKEESFFELNQFNVVPSNPIKGAIYEKYYNLFNDPVTNFFSLEEKGLTNSSGLVDPKLRNTGFEKKQDGNRQYYIQDLDKMQEFYQDFDTRFELRKTERRKSVIEAEQEKLRIILSQVARKEIRILLALARVNKYLPEESQELRSAINSFNQTNDVILNKLFDLDEEITRLSKRVDELKPDPNKIKKILKEKSPECFDKIDTPIVDCGDVKNKLGTDPLFQKTIGGTDPLLPTQNQLCYWKEFSKLATLAGLLPIPNGPKIGQFRYWPVGLIIPTPAVLIKIPLPIVWLPLLVISTPLGNIVFFLTINGIFISPVVFLISSTGFKQHIITVRGPSKRFGYSADDETIKADLNLPVAVLAAKDQIERIAREKSGGLYPDFNEFEKKQILRHKSILKKSEELALKNGNENRILKNAKEKRNLEQATSGIKNFEKIQQVINKIDTAKDCIEDAKQAVFNRIDELGKPAINRCNRIKEKIISRERALLADLQKALSQNDISRAAQIRQQMQTDAIPLNEKIDALTEDLKDYYKKIKFPKIIIPKDKATIDPKQNAIVELLQIVRDFLNINGSQFFSKDDSQVKTIFLKLLAKNKNKIRENGSKYLSSDGYIDLEKDADSAKKFLLDANKTIVDAATGQAAVGNVIGQKQKIDELQQKINSESDPIKKIKLGRELTAAQNQLVDILENDRTQLALALTTAVMAQLGQIKIEFDPFAACCNRKKFALSLSISPAIPIFNSAKLLLDAAVSALSAQDLKNLFGGKTRVTSRELTTVHLALIRRAIPTGLEIPLPDLNLISFAKSFTGLLISLFEVKAPNAAAQPALPTSITIDLNLLKGPLLKLLLAFLENSLPDPKNTPGIRGTADSAINLSSVPRQNSTTVTVAGPNGSPISSTVDPDLSIVTCDPETGEFSLLSDGTYNPEQTHSGNPGYTQNSNSSPFSGGNVILNSKKDILPNFQTLDIDFLNINPGDLLVILKNFVDLKFNAIENLLDPFYILLSLVKSPKGVNLNLLEAIQFKIPPTGPPEEALFFAITSAKKNAPRAANFRMIDLPAAKQKISQLEPVLKPVSAIASVLAAVAGAADAALPPVKIPKIDTLTGELRTEDPRKASATLRQLHPMLNQDDIPPWERLTLQNLLFALFVDEFVASGADRVGFFRAYL